MAAQAEERETEKKHVCERGIKKERKKERERVRKKEMGRNRRRKIEIE